MSISVHTIAQTGFGKANELYDRARPTYPASALSAIHSALISSPPFNVLEVGVGTGIFTRAFLAHPECSSTLHELRAVEPSEGMRTQFSRTIDDPRVSVREGTFEQTHVPDGWADLVVVAQAFHWCQDYNKAMAEFARALKPNGRVVFIWNLEDDAIGWIHQLREVVQAFELGTPQYRLGLWRQTFETESYLKNFEPPEEFVFKHTVTATTLGVIERACSKSYIAIRSDAEKAQLSKDLADIVKSGDDKVWINEREDTFEYPYINTVVIMRKK